MNRVQENYGTTFPKPNIVSRLQVQCTYHPTGLSFIATLVKSIVPVYAAVVSTNLLMSEFYKRLYLLYLSKYQYLLYLSK